MDIETVRDWLAAEATASGHSFTREATATALTEIERLQAIEVRIIQRATQDRSEDDPELLHWLRFGTISR